MALTPADRLNDSPSAYDSENSEQRSVLSLMRKFFSKPDDSKLQSTLPTRVASRWKPSAEKRSSRRIASNPPARLHTERETARQEQQTSFEKAPSPERRALSADGQRPLTPRRGSPIPIDLARTSAPTFHNYDTQISPMHTDITPPLLSAYEDDSAAQLSLIDSSSRTSYPSYYPREISIPSAPEALAHEQPSTASATSLHTETRPIKSESLNGFADNYTLDEEAIDDTRTIDEEMHEELEKRWILNLSMHFREKTPREKFFVTYAETPNLWRRITVSVEYHHAAPDSLEADLQSLLYQRDKSARIYESIRSSLADIEFFDTVTNLRLETSDDDRLHVHVTEDVNEIIPYPQHSLLDHIDHIDIPRFSEEDVNFESHMSGFVYKVSVDGERLIKKEIPGPDSVEEFLYEINALYNLRGTKNVVQFKGLVVNEQLGVVKGILIAYAENGPLVDYIYDYGPQLTWESRERWAMEIVKGLSEIHEAGYVQGDFTLSNIVLDEHYKAIIIDINRRGCPVGWEPPEIATMIASGQRISMYIGVKSDLFQLGMVLWALAEQTDEPERQERPLPPLNEKIPQYYREIVSTCLEQDPRKRLSAKELSCRFPQLKDSLPISQPWTATERRTPHSNQSQTEYIDPETAVGLDDIRNHKEVEASPSRTGSNSRRVWSSQTAYESRPSSVASHSHRGASCIVPRRGRSPPRNTAHLASPAVRQPNGEAMEDLHAQIVPVSPSDERPWEEVVGEDGKSYLIRAEGILHGPQGLSRRATQLAGPSLDEAVLQPRFTHVDSGLGDMGTLSRENTDLELGNPRVRRFNTGGLPTVGHVDSGFADMEFIGIGENETLKDYCNDDIDEGPLGRRGGELEPVEEYEVLENFGGDELSPRDTIAAYDKAFAGYGEDAHDGVGSSVNASVGSSQQHAPEKQDGASTASGSIPNDGQQCKYS